MNIFIKILFIFFILTVAFLPEWISPPIALCLGFIFVLVFDNPFEQASHKLAKYLLQLSIIGLGFGININNALNVSGSGFFITTTSIIGTLLVGFLIGKLLKVDKKTSHLISAGTAICGGSAIATISPIIKASEKEMSVSLGIIFILNSVALFIFPLIGNYLDLSQTQFGIWAAIAIHDTSSVIGAASVYGEEALEIATTIKLGRALWIIPLAMVDAFIFKTSTSKKTFPYFIVLFIVAMIINSLLPQFEQVFSEIKSISKQGLSVTLFLIGASLSLKKLKELGIKAFIQGVSLWLLISLATLAFVYYYL